MIHLDHQFEDEDEEDMTCAPLRFVGLMSPADLDALQTSAASIEAALVEAQQEEDRRAAELAAAQARIAELEAKLAEMTTDRDAWQRHAAQWKARWEHDSPDAYNARINEAVRHLTQQTEAQHG